MVWTTVLSLPAQSVNVVERVQVLLCAPQMSWKPDKFFLNLSQLSDAVAFSTNSSWVGLAALTSPLNRTRVLDHQFGCCVSQPFNGS